jgi:hypothetical protein
MALPPVGIDDVPPADALSFACWLLQAANTGIASPMAVSVAVRRMGSLSGAKGGSTLRSQCRGCSDSVKKKPPHAAMLLVPQLAKREVGVGTEGRLLVGETSAPKGRGEGR